MNQYDFTPTTSFWIFATVAFNANLIQFIKCARQNKQLYLEEQVELWPQKHLSLVQL